MKVSPRTIPGLLLVAVAFSTVPAVAHAQAKALLFEAPAGTGDVPLLKAAKALATRCAAQGLKGVTGDIFAPVPPGPKRVRLTAPNEFTEAQVPVVEFLASFPCRTIELRFEHFLSKTEKDLYQEGEKAPKGSSWIDLHVWEKIEKPVVHFKKSEAPIATLMRDKPVIDVSGKCKILRHGGGNLHGYDREAGIYLTFSGAAAKTLYSGIVKSPDPPHKDVLPVNLFIDGTRFPTDNGFMGWRNLAGGEKDPPDLAIWTFPDLTAATPIPTLLEHPLPFALKRAE